MQQMTLLGKTYDSSSFIGSFGTSEPSAGRLYNGSFNVDNKVKYQPKELSTLTTNEKQVYDQIIKNLISPTDDSLVYKIDNDESKKQHVLNTKLTLVNNNNFNNDPNSSNI